MSKKTEQRLPVDTLCGQVQAAVCAGRSLVVTAPTGSGKSTRLPLQLLAARPDDGRLWVVLQPRRMAARLLAARVAAELGEQVGETVGYAMRHAQSQTARTRILYVTEGWLLRRLLRERDWQWLAGVVLDEYHERHLEGDVVLALLKLRAAQGWDGQIVVMSATLDSAPLVTYLGNAVALAAEGRSYPVEVRHVGDGGVAGLAPRDFAARTAAALKAALKDGAEADILVFLPGKPEINATWRLLNEAGWLRGYELCPLHGELPLEEQRRVVEPSARPRIILSTNVAESSVTLPTVRTVIDGGYERAAVHDMRRGLNQLLTERISLASATQRAGRAGRVAPGRCYRCWRARDEGHFEARRRAEIERLDLAAIRLELTAAGVADALPWFETPPPEAWERAGQLLESIGAIGAGAVTQTGALIARFPLHPRHGRILIEAAARGVLDKAIAAVAILEGRALRLRGVEKAAVASDLWAEVEAFEAALAARGGREWFERAGIHHGAFAEALKVVQQITRTCEKVGLGEGCGDAAEADSFEAFGAALVAGYADAVARKVGRGTAQYRRANGKVGVLRKDSVVRDAELIVSCDSLEQATANGVQVLLGMNTALSEATLRAVYPQAFKAEGFARLDKTQRKVEWVNAVRFGTLVLSESVADSVPPGQAEPLLAQSLARGDWPLPRWDAQVDNWIARLNVLAHWHPELEIAPFTEADRLLVLEQLCEGATRYKAVKERPVLPLVQQWLADGLLPLMERWVPERFTLPTGRAVKLRYESPTQVVLSAKIQQLYDVPGAQLRICDGRCPLRIELLAPNQRPVHITDDLDAFWAGQYAQVRKDLFGRYPKHEWR